MRVHVVTTASPLPKVVNELLGLRARVVCDEMGFKLIPMGKFLGANAALEHHRLQVDGFVLFQLVHVPEHSGTVWLSSYSVCNALTCG